MMGRGGNQRPYTPIQLGHDRNAFVCNTCGALVWLQVTHTQWHERLDGPDLPDLHGLGGRRLGDPPLS